VARVSSFTVVTDLDLAFHGFGLDYNQDPPQGIADACSRRIASIPGLSSAFCQMRDHLNLLAAPAARPGL
jgi:pilus assembly protein CpaE